MTDEPLVRVRPTQRCLTDIGAAVPDLGYRLSQLDHPDVRKAQTLPVEDEAGRAERIRCLTDRRWLKVKTSDLRAAAGDLAHELPENVLQFGERWWLVAAGHRQQDSAQRDFYAQIEREAHSGGRNTCSTDFLLPTSWDVDRLTAEAAVFATKVIQAHVRHAARESLLNSDTRAFRIGDADVRVRIRMQPDGMSISPSEPPGCSTSPSSRCCSLCSPASTVKSGRRNPAVRSESSLPEERFSGPRFLRQSCRLD